MDKNTHVYCTDCQNFILKETDSDIEIDCKFADKCWFFNPEDSTPFYKRPYWISKKEKKG